MENRRGSDIFLGVVGVTTLLVAIIGATFAYFSANAQSANEAIAVQSTTVELGYKDNAPEGLKTAMIPSTPEIAAFAAFDPDWVKGEKTYELSDGSTIKAQGQCIDQVGNEVCSVYEFWIGNPSETTGMEVEGSLNIVTNEFGNLKFSIYDEAGTAVIEEKVLTGSGTSVELTELNQNLIGYEEVANKEGVSFDSKDPTTYNPALDMSNPDNAGKETNVRHYKMVIWIDETGENQKDEDASKSFAAGISFSTGGETGGVTGVIAVAQ